MYLTEIEPDEIKIQINAKQQKQVMFLVYM